VPKVCNISKGQIVNYNDQPCRVAHIDVQTPSARGANTLYKLRMNDITTGRKVEQTFKGNQLLEELELERRPVSYIFREQEMYTFMDSESFEQYTLAQDNIEEALVWLTEGMEGLTALFLDGIPIGIEIPAALDLEIVETAPAMKGASATNRNKPATLSNGVTVMVPEYIPSGEVIRVNTETGKYMSRAKG
jgi:elongation factor P